MRRTLLLLCVAFFGAHAEGEKKQQPTHEDYATLETDATDGSVVLRVGEKDVRASIDFSSAHVGDCTNSTYQSLTFGDDVLTKPEQSVLYSFRRNADSACSDAAVVGMKTTKSPLWNIWSYASFSRSEIRLGRNHPKNAGLLKRGISPSDVILECAGGAAENMCMVSSGAHVANLPRSYRVDFHSRDEHIYVPNEVFLHYTSAHNCNNATSFAQWPPFVVSFEDNEVTVRSTTLVNDDVAKEYYDSEVGVSCEYMSTVLRKSGVLVPHEHSTLISLGRSFLREYTIDRDYVHSTVRMRAVFSNDHFSLLETFLVMFVFTVYIAHKIESMERIGSYILGFAPLCSVCMSSTCFTPSTHPIVWRMRILQYACILALFGIAWYTVSFSSRVGIGYDETILVVWSFVVLGVATAEYFASCAVLFATHEPNKRTDASSQQYWVLSSDSAVDSACVVAMFSLTSVIRGDDLSSSLLNTALAFLILYDGVRRLFAEIMCFAGASTGLSGFRTILWLTHTTLVTAGVGVGFSAYAMCTHVFYPTLSNSIAFTAIVCLFAAYLAFTITLAYVRSAIVTHMRVAYRESQGVKK